MNAQVSIIILVCLMSSCLSIPIQTVPERPEKDDIQQATVPESLNLLQSIMKKGEDSSQLLREGDIAIHLGRNARICGNSCYWPKSSNGIVYVPYTLHRAYYDVGLVGTITNGMQEFATLTCIQFVERTTEEDYILILPFEGCWSSVGRDGGAQKLSLTGECFDKRGYLQHELNHALGFYHEQNRSDRDDYVTIRTEYIFPEALPNFEKVNTNNLGMKYDYSSVMHYPGDAYSNTPGQATIIPKPNPATPIGQRDGLSSLDIDKINALYNCGMCRTLLTDPKGTVNSTNYPLPYPNNANCIYLIRGTFEKVVLQFDAFELQSSPGCASDYIKVYDGESKASPVLLDKTCGTSLILPLYSTGNAMLIEFVSDGSITASGFKASYNNVICGGIFNSSRGTFSSPGYPGKYPFNMDCGYYIVAPVGYRVSLTAFDINLEVNPGVCIYDYLDIFDGARPNSRLIGKYCGRIRVPAAISTGNTMRLQFHSDFFLSLEGFQASYTFVTA